MDLQPVLPIYDLDEDEINRIYEYGPETAEEYLLWVRMQSEEIGDVVRADIDPTEFAQNQSASYFPVSLQLHPCDVGYLPAAEFTNSMLAKFADLRQYLCELAAHGVGGKEATERVPVPAMKDEQGWHRFCFGSSIPEIGDDSSSDQSDDQTSSHEDELETGEESKPQIARQFDEACMPRAQLVLQFDQVLTRKLLGYHIRWLQMSDLLTTARGVWLYALLARLERPLTSDVSAMLRELYMKLCELRARTTENMFDQEDPTVNNVGLATLNILAVVAGRYFEQEELITEQLDEREHDEFVL